MMVLLLDLLQYNGYKGNWINWYNRNRNILLVVIVIIMMEMLILIIVEEYSYGYKYLNNVQLYV